MKLIDHARYVPESWIRFLGRLQFKCPWLRGAVRLGARHLFSTEGIIQRGIGEGLRFHGSGGYPGYLLGTSEPQEQATIARLLRAEDVFYDIGANVGFYSTIAARLVSGAGRVFAFEPLPASAEACRQNAQINGFNHVTVVQAAASSKPGRAKLKLLDGSAGHRLSGADDGMDVPVVTIDAWRVATGAPLPNVVMIDVEGAELDVMKGMMQTIRDARPAIMVEVHWLGEQFTDFLQGELTSLGYCCTTYTGGAIPSGITRFHALLQVAL